ncbi:MAG: HlyD family efflux transporter periplasmic adaptor subunit [Planctomycetia bacterium]|nr:HlyD family efflux transporter periplasmic adaptor subunit [Planctomycetia bacterium]
MKWTIVALIVVLLLAVAAWSGMSSGTVVQCAAVAPAPIREFVDEQAQTRLPVTQLITMPFDGRVEAIELSEGAVVKKGQVVAKVVPQDLQLTVQDAQANIDRLESSIKESGDKTVESTALKQSLEYVLSMQATVAAAAARVEAGEAKLDYANKNFGRIRTLRETNSASEDQWNNAELQRIQADVDLRQDQLVLKALQSMLSATTLVPTVVKQYMDRKDLTVAVLKNERAQAEVKLAQQVRDRDRGSMQSPIDGVVLERLETNERRLAPGTVLLKIGAPGQLEVEADILSQDVVRVKPEQGVEVYGPAVGAQPARGIVAAIYPAGFTKVSSLGVEQQRVKVIVRFAPGELERIEKMQDLGIGYRVRVRIFTAEKPRTLVVPRSALFRGPDGRWQVFAVRSGKAKLVGVEVGLMNDEQVEVTTPLAEGELVVLAPESTLTDGARVSPTNSQ